MSLTIETYPLNILCDLTNIVYNNADEFINRFCFDSTMLIAGITFGTKTVKVSFITDSGQHISNSIDLIDFYRFVSDVKQ